jgi:putative transposase
MGTASFVQNAIVQIEGIDYRLIRKIDDTCWQLEHSKTKRIVEFQHNELLRMNVEQRLTFPASLAVSRVGPANCGMSTQDFEFAKLRRSYVLAVLDVPNTREKLERAVEDVWKRIRMPEKPPAYVSVYRWKKRFIQAHNDIRALVDNSCSKGNRTSRFPSEVTAICQESISTSFMKRERTSIQKTFEDALRKVKRENELRPSCDALPLPTRRLINRIIAKIPAFDKHSARYGHDAARREFRSVKGHSVTQEPLERAESVGVCSRRP